MAKKRERDSIYLELANMLHDMRGPVSVVLGYAQAAMAATDGGVLKNALLQIELHGQKLRDQFSQLSAGLMAKAIHSMQMEAVNISRALQEACLHMRDAQGIALDVPEGVYVWANRVQVDRVIDNLIANAVKYGSNVRVSMKTRGRRCVVAISNSCERMSKCKLRRIYSPGVRYSDSADGLGLGLNSARSAARNMGGAIHAKPIARGVEFTIALPLCPPGRLPSDAAETINRHAGA